jgi:hypothetical protein
MPPLISQDENVYWMIKNFDLLPLTNYP